MINLHMHTNNSDGVLTPIELLKKIEQNGIKIASITDHDNVNTYLSLRGINIGDYYTGILIPGVEVKCTFQEYPIEILGYFIDADYLKPYFDQKDKRIWEFQKEAFEQGKKVARELGLKFDDEDISPGTYAGIALFDLLNKYCDYNIRILGPEIMENRGALYRNAFSNPDSPFFVSEESLGFSATETVAKIHEAGGVAILAHPGQYKMIKDKMKFLNDICSSTDIDGIECYYLLHTEEETKAYLDFCRQHNLLISGGSDFHGTLLQNIIRQDNIDPNDFEWINNFRKKDNT